MGRRRAGQGDEREKIDKKILPSLMHLKNFILNFKMTIAD